MLHATCCMLHVACIVCKAPSNSHPARPNTDVVSPNVFDNPNPAPSSPPSTPQALQLKELEASKARLEEQLAALQAAQQPAQQQLPAESQEDAAAGHDRTGDQKQQAAAGGHPRGKEATAPAGAEATDVRSHGAGDQREGRGAVLDGAVGAAKASRVRAARRKQGGFVRVVAPVLQWSGTVGAIALGAVMAANRVRAPE